MSNKALIYILNTVLLSIACIAPVNAETPAVDPAQIEKLTQTVANGVLVKLGMSDDTKPELQNMSLDKVVSEAMHAGKPIEAIREAVNQTMVEVTGKPLDATTPQEEAPASAVVEAEASPVAATADGGAVDAEGVERTIPLTTVLLPNESLSSVAKRIYGPDQGRRYLDIYQLNKDEIPNINVIPEGTVLKLPQ